MKTLLSWSSGKDSAWTLHKLRSEPGIEIAGLVTAINAEFDRVAMHGVRRALVEAQARAAALPLTLIEIPNPCPNDVYEARMAAFVEAARDNGIEAMAFGDLFLEDIRAYREDRLKGSGITPLFPIWIDGKDTGALAADMMSSGLKAAVACLDPQQLPRSFAARDFDAAFVTDLPPGVDPCGENGEFHTFAFDGPMFRAPIKVTRGEVVERSGFVFCDLLPG